MVKLPHLSIAVIRRNAKSKKFTSPQDSSDPLPASYRSVILVSQSTYGLPSANVVYTSNSGQASRLSLSSAPIVESMTISSNLPHNYRRASGTSMLDEQQSSYETPTAYSATSYPISRVDTLTTSVIGEISTVRSLSVSTVVSVVTVTLPPQVTQTTLSASQTSLGHQTTSKAQSSRNRSRKTHHKSNRNTRASTSETKSSSESHTYTDPWPLSSQESHPSVGQRTKRPPEITPSRHSTSDQTFTRSLKSSTTTSERSTETRTTVRSSVKHSTTDVSSKTASHSNTSKFHTSHAQVSSHPSQQPAHQTDASSTQVSPSKIVISVFGTLGGLAIVAGLVLIIFLCLRRRRRKKREKTEEKHKGLPEISRPILPAADLTTRVPSQWTPLRAPPIPPRSFSRPSPPRTPPRGPLRVVNNIATPNSRSSDWSYSVDSRGQRRWSNPFDME